MADLRNERETLMQVARDLESGRIAHAKYSEDDKLENPGFNLTHSAMDAHCGTVACIGGWAWLYENPNDIYGASAYVFSIEESNEGDELTPMFRLFYLAGEGISNYDMNAITPQQAAKAIYNYLDGAEHPWDGVE